MTAAQPPVFELFPSSPHVVLLNDTMVLHTELSPTTHLIQISWHHSSEIYSNFIFEDPFCNPQLEVGTIINFRQYYKHSGNNFVIYFLAENVIFKGKALKNTYNNGVTLNLNCELLHSNLLSTTLFLNGCLTVFPLVL